VPDSAIDKDSVFLDAAHDAHKTADAAVLPKLIQVTPAVATISTNMTAQFKAQLLFSNATVQDVTSTANWTATPAKVASIDPNGLAKGLFPGAATVSAAAMGVQGSAGLVVIAPEISGLKIVPSTATLTAGAAIQFTAMMLFNDNTEMNATSSVTWSSADPAIATAGPTGVCKGIKPGATTISASLSGFTANAVVSVN